LKPEEYFSNKMMDIQQNWLENELKRKSDLSTKYKGSDVKNSELLDTESKDQPYKDSSTVLKP
jgi:hypothetical protein